MTVSARAGHRSPAHSVLVAGAIALAAASLVSACASGLEEARSQNRGRLFLLEPGQSRDEVLQLMGTEPQTIAASGFRSVTIPRPYDSETHTVSGSVWEFLYFPGDLQGARFPLDDAELVPLVLRDGSLQGWGWGYLNQVVASLGIQRIGPRAPSVEDKSTGDSGD